MNNQTYNEAGDLHSIFQMLQTIEVGLFVLDRNNTVRLWNSFMENHSGIRTAQAKESDLFQLFPYLPRKWVQRKIDFVFNLKSRAYSTWEQRPHLFQFSSARPLTSRAPLMFQNITLTPLLGADGEVAFVCFQVHDVTEIAVNKQALENANDELKRLSQTDRLTNLYNRGHWEDLLKQEFHRIRRYKSFASLILFDIDHFKKVNDSYGHQAGDDVLRFISTMVHDNLRESDIAGRYGGEEFSILLPETNGETARMITERLRNQIKSSPVTTSKETLDITVSFGIAEYSQEFLSYIEWLEAADNALYQSKRCGRDRSTLFASTKTEQADL